MDSEKYAQVVAAIQAERTRREYQVNVWHVHRAHWVGDRRIPDELEAYSALSECTEHTPPCTWADFAFWINEKWVVVLQNDFFREGMSLSRSAPLVLAELVEKQEQSKTK